MKRTLLGYGLILAALTAATAGTASAQGPRSPWGPHNGAPPPA